MYSCTPVFDNWSLRFYSSPEGYSVFSLYPASLLLYRSTLFSGMLLVGSNRSSSFRTSSPKSSEC
ncbi:unnamed protein product [Nippostrongylus brasiliensis]|uniref:Uncharacterized protein n=1 Tax=Nippostrongylus brasiliensis TaxID=27835 RepID=A0A0N4XIP9_NIPBR|nr:unnamed protein product [Nippostrongylus brasiliensis]